MTTPYAANYGSPTAGKLGDGSQWMEALKNGTGAALPVGIFVKESSEGVAALLSAATDVPVGAVVNSYARNPSGLTGASDAVADKDEFNSLAEGLIYMAAEQTMAVGDPVYARFATKGGNTQVGKIRKDPDGVAEVHTLTPTAVNSKVYVLRVTTPSGVPYTFEYQGDGSATAQEICDGFRAVMAADAGFTAELVGSGTTTLILTAQVAGKAFVCQAEGDGALADVVTTPAAATALRVKGARVRSGGGTSAPPQIYFSAAAEAAQH